MVPGICFFKKLGTCDFACIDCPLRSREGNFINCMRISINTNIHYFSCLHSYLMQTMPHLDNHKIFTSFLLTTEHVIQKFPLPCILFFYTTLLMRYIIQTNFIFSMTHTLQKYCKWTLFNREHISHTNTLSATHIT